MDVFITGGTGFVGSTLTRRLTEQGDSVTVLTRRARADASLPKGAYFLEGDPSRQGKWQESAAEHEVIINLAGAPIFARWNHKTKRVIRESRVETTKNLVKAISGGKSNVSTLISTSAVGYYGFHGDEILGEDSLPGDDFLATVTREWEAAALKAEHAGIRVLICRFGIVLGRSGGALGQMVPIFRIGLGAPLGRGSQWFSWIHEQDLVRIHLFLIGRKDLSGPVNCTTPNPVRNRDLTHALGKTLRRPTLMPPVPGFMLRIIKGEVGTVLVKGQRVMPERLLKEGFDFRFPGIYEALGDLLGK